MKERMAFRYDDLGAHGKRDHCHMFVAKQKSYVNFSKDVYKCNKIIIPTE